MKVLITGATGFLGHQLAIDLIEKGHNVYNFSRSSSKELDQIGVRTINGDLQNQSDINLVLKEEFDAIFHVASKVGMWGRWKDFYNVNFNGSKLLFDTSVDHGVKYFIYTSTPSVVFGKEEIIEGNENIPYPKTYLSLYAKSKALAESYILNHQGSSIKTCSIRPHLIFGKNDKNIIPRLIQAKKRNKLKIIGNGKNLVDVIHVKNASMAHIQALEELSTSAKNNKKAYFIGQEKPVYLWDFINEILRIKGLAPVTDNISTQAAYKIGHIIEIFLNLFRIFNIHPPMTRFVALQLGTSHYFSHQRAENDFGYSPKLSLKESLEDI